MAKNLKSLMKSTSILAILLIAILGTTFTAHASETYYGTIVTSTSWQYE